MVSTARNILSTILYACVLHGFGTAIAADPTYSDYAKDVVQKSDQSSFSTDIKGQLQPVKHAVISSEITSSIVAINVQDSEAFKKGDALVEFQCNVERAELKKAQAVQKADKARVSINKKLDELSSISQLDYKLALYKAEESASDVAVIRERVKYCTIKAPYSGVVEEVLRQPHEYVNKGDPVLKILDDSVLEIELLVSSDWVTWLKRGTTFKVNVSELDKAYEATITNIGTKIDPVSQSIKIKGSISNEEKILKPGMSVTAHFEK